MPSYEFSLFFFLVLKIQTHKADSPRTLSIVSDLVVIKFSYFKFVIAKILTSSKYITLDLWMVLI